MATEMWWCRICNRRIRTEELEPVSGPDGLFPVNHTKTIFRGGKPQTICHTLERRAIA